MPEVGQDLNNVILSTVTGCFGSRTESEPCLVEIGSFMKGRAARGCAMSEDD